MFDYLQKFNQLPKDLRDKVSTPPVMAAIDDLEKKYGIDLASVVMRVMVREIELSGLTDYLAREGNLDIKRASELEKELEEDVFKSVKDYLGVKRTSPGKEGEQEKLKEKVEVKEKEKAIPFVKGASFFFSPEDEEEIRELTKKINGELKAGLSDEQIEDKLNKIMAAAQINFGSQQLIDRFRNILKIYLRGVRDRIETKQTLKKDFAGGGLGFDNDSADEILKITDGVKGGERISLKPPVKIKLPEEAILSRGEEKDVGLKDIGVRDIDYSFSSKKEEKKEESIPKPPSNLPTEKKEEIKKPEKLDIEHELAPPPPVVAKEEPIREIAKVPGPSQVKSKIEVKESIPSPRPDFKKPVGKAPLRVPTPSEPAGKKKMEDVKYVSPKVMNPIDELHYMDLVNFRRLGPEIRKQVAKIRGKINLLEEENYSRKIEGVKGWRQSPVNKLYISIGQQSISENKPIDVIIEERKNAGQDYLTLEEFKAIMDLNKELRF